MPCPPEAAGFAGGAFHFGADPSALSIVVGNEVDRNAICLPARTDEGVLMVLATVDRLMPAGPQKGS